jgi:hypothetical protein
VEIAEAEAERRLRQRLTGAASAPVKVNEPAERQLQQQPLPTAPQRQRSASASPSPSPSPLELPSGSPGTAASAAAPAGDAKAMAAQPSAAGRNSSAAEPSAMAVEGGAGEPPPLDPEDWSDELAQIDLELKRLGWNRDQEATYLERAFGHPSRNRITTYADLVAYSQALAGFPDGSDAAAVAVPLRRRDLLHQCDQLLAQLRWQPAHGRAFLEQHFQRSSRRQLNDEQLLHFNMLLESEMMASDET